MKKGQAQQMVNTIDKKVQELSEHDKALTIKYLVEEDTLEEAATEISELLGVNFDCIFEIINNG